MEQLPNLSSLDLSGTNLAGTGVFETGRADDMMVGCDIPGLVSRVKTPLDFLGLYKSSYEACCRVHIPAKKVR